MAVIVVVIAIIVIIVVVVIVVVVVVVVVVIIIAFDVGIDKITARFGSEGFEKLLRDTSRRHNDVRCADVDDMWITTNTILEIIKLDVIVMFLE
jgi:hypothetical protein